MNRRTLLNFMIFGLVTFYLVFSLVHRNFFEQHAEQVDLLETKWQQKRLVPVPWTITRIEAGDLVVKQTEQGWQLLANNQQLANPEQLQTLIANWQGVKPERIDFYQQLPEQGATILVFIAEDSQPLIFRVLQAEQQLHFYRMLDNRKFTLDAETLLLPSQLLPK